VHKTATGGHYSDFHRRRIWDRTGVFAGRARKVDVVLVVLGSESSPHGNPKPLRFFIFKKKIS